MQCLLNALLSIAYIRPAECGGSSQPLPAGRVLAEGESVKSRVDIGSPVTCGQESRSGRHPVLVARYCTTHRNVPLGANRASIDPTSGVECPLLRTILHQPREGAMWGLCGKGGGCSRPVDIDSRRIQRCGAVVLAGLLASGLAEASPVRFQNGTATFSQGVLGGGPYSPEMAIDGIFYTGTPCCSNGWTINHFPDGNPANEFTTDETAVWETVSDLGPSFLTFTMYFLDPNPGHLLGRFRLSVTADDRSTYADGLRENGDVTANWTVLEDLVVEGPSGMTFTNLPDESILAGGVVPGQGVYDVSAVANLTGITGIRLEVLKDPSLPGVVLGSPRTETSS